MEARGARVRRFGRDYLYVAALTSTYKWYLGVRGHI